MKRTTSVVIKINGTPTVITAQVCKPVLEKNDTTGQNVLCGYIRRNGRKIRVHRMNGGTWVSTWDFSGIL